MRSVRLLAFPRSVNSVSLGSCRLISITSSPPTSDMVCLGDMHKLLTIVAIIAACFNSARAGDFSLQSAGARFGFSSSDSVDFHQVDLLANWNLPWKWELGSHLRLKTRFDLSAGWLGDP